MPRNVILLACGTFNPITNLHLRMFELARDKLNRTGRYAVIKGLISPVNDKYGKKGMVSGEHRCEMIRLALQGNDWVRLSTWEVEQENWTPTFLTLMHHQHAAEEDWTKQAALHQPDSSLIPSGTADTSSSENAVAAKLRRLSASVGDAESPPIVKLLCGADVVESFAVPGLWKQEHMEAIVRDFGIVCLERAGSSVRKFIYENDFLASFENNIDLVEDWCANDVSATKVRRAVRRKETIKYLVQDSVVEYISQHKLYMNTTNDL